MDFNRRRGLNLDAPAPICVLVSGPNPLVRPTPLTAVERAIAIAIAPPPTSP